jgi:AhpD family alkylhydroperoxidase
MSMTTIRIRKTAFAALAFATGLAAAALAPAPAYADDVATEAEATYADIEATFGGVPSFMMQFPKAGIAGAWAQLKGLEFGDTALATKTKALIGIAVAAQVPCHYCVWADTNTAKAAGASDEEIGEAVAIAALTRHWSTFFHGMQVDFERFKMELGGEAEGQ